MSTIASGSKYHRLYSLIGLIAEGIDRLINSKKIGIDSSIYLYGLDRNSFAMKTILAHRGIQIKGYILGDEYQVIKARQDIANFAYRYLNRKDGLAEIILLDSECKEYIADGLILVTSNDYINAAVALEKNGFRENADFFCVSDLKIPVLATTEGKKKFSFREVQFIEKDILAYLDWFCAERKIQYWVGGGTMLGAVRHHGFIPWDDDIDIMMPWEDYLRFLEEFSKQDRYGIFGMGLPSGKDYPEPFCKVTEPSTLVIENMGTLMRDYGVWVDVFPMIGVPSDAAERKLFFKKYNELNRSIWQDFYANDGDLSVFSKWAEKRMQYITRYDYHKSDYIGVIGTVYDERDSTTKEAFQKTVRMPFEDIEVNVPEGYDEYLSNHYGDYMKLPPEKDRISHHDIAVFWR